MLTPGLLHMHREGGGEVTSVCGSHPPKREVQKEVGEDSHAEAAPGAATLSGDLVSGG